jgi:hypothetical protein
MAIKTTLTDGEHQYSIRLTHEVTLTVENGVVTACSIDDEHNPSFYATGASSDGDSKELTRVAELVWGEGMGQG